MTRLRRLLLTALAALAALLAAATPAAAHGQKVLISLEAAADSPGTAEITAVVSFEGDGHPVDDATLQTTAVSGTQQVEVQLAPSGAPGTYTGTAELAPGNWEITTEATGDHTGTAVAELTVAAATTTTAPPPTTAVVPSAAPPSEPAAAEEGINLALVLIPVGLVVIGTAVLALRRTRRT